MAIETNASGGDGGTNLEPASGAPSSRPAGALINRVLAGRYELLEMIGEGPLLAAFRARDRSLNRVVAVKTLLTAGGVAAAAGQETILQKLRAGLGEVLALTHPNITRAFDVGADDASGVPVFLAEEYVRGIDLKERIRRAAPFQLTAATDCAALLAEALEFAHARGIAHGDVRPQNILIGPEGQVKLSNFGVAEAQNVALYQDPSLLRRVVAYVAPEAAASARPTASADLYSLGVILYEMLTGDLPYKGDNPVQIALKHAQEPIPSPRIINAGVPRALEGIVIKALGKRPEERYGSASEMLADLREVRDALRYGKSLAWSPLDRTRHAAATAPAPAAPVSVDSETGIPARGASSAAAIVPGAISTAASLPVSALDEDDEEAAVDGTIVMPGAIRGAAALQARRGGSVSSPRSAAAAASREEYEDEDAPRGRRGGRGGNGGGGSRWLTFINLFLLLLVLGALGGLVYMTMNFFQPQDEVVVPNLVGKTITDAKTLATDQKFTLATVDEQYQDRIPADTIYQQRPAPGYHIREGKQVSIWVSRGPHMADVPDVRDTAFDRAKKVIEANGLRVGDYTYEFDPIAARGNVLRQSPQPGESRPRGTKVDLVLSKGEEPTPTPEPLPTPGLDTGVGGGGAAGAAAPDTSNPDDPNNRERTFSVGYKVPSDGQPHHIRIDVIDRDGPRTAYDQENQSGEKVSTDVTGIGKQITIKLYDNDALRSEQTR